MEEDDVVERLRALAYPPISDARSREVRAAMLHPTGAAVRRRTRWKVGVAAFVGLLAGGMGLVSAGALPAGMQDAASSALDNVGIHVPPGHERFNDPVICPGGPYRNHGEYVRTHKDDPNAGSSPCGKPVQAVTGKDDTSEDEDDDESTTTVTEPIDEETTTTARG